MAVQKKKESQQMRWNSLLVPCQRLFCTASEIELNFVCICICIYRLCLCFYLYLFFCKWSRVEDCKECTSALFQSMNHCCRLSIFWPTTSFILFSSIVLLTNNLNCQILNFKLLAVYILTINSILYIQSLTLFWHECRLEQLDKNSFPCIFPPLHQIFWRNMLRE